MLPNICHYNGTVSVTYDFVLTFHWSLSLSCIVCNTSVNVEKF